MKLAKTLLCAALLASSLAAWAQPVEGLIVKAGDTESQFAITAVKELTFSDEGLTVVKTDDATVSFPAEWTIRFGEIESTGALTFATASDADSPVQVYDAQGRFVLDAQSLADFHIASLPAGVYIIKCDGQTLKIRK